MVLTLRIGPLARLAPGQLAERRLESGRLRIGRATVNDVVLSDPTAAISRHHCVIKGSGSSFCVIDTSTNGVFINDEGEPVGNGNTCQLRDGDRLRIGDYVIAVELAGARAEALRVDAEASALPQSPIELGGFASVTELFTDQGGMSSPPGGGGREPTMLQDLELGPPIDEPVVAPEGRSAEGSVHVSAAGMADHPMPPLVPTAPQPPNDGYKPCAAGTLRDVSSPAPASAQVPEDVWNMLEGGAEPPPPAAIVPPVVAHPGAPTNGREQPIEVAGRFAEAPVATAPADEEVGQCYMNAFFRGAGLDPEVVLVDQPEEKMHQIGQILRGVVEGVMGLMESRRAIKGEYRLDVTQFQPQRNNPLKFEVDAESAVKRLLGPPQRGYLTASEAFADAISDLKEHEMAMLAGIQAVWRHAVQLFDPKALESRLGEDSGLGGLLASKKARCWDAFVTLYEATVGTTKDEYDRTAGRIFAEGYDKQIGRQREC